MKKNDTENDIAGRKGKNIKRRKEREDKENLSKKNFPVEHRQ